MKRKRLPNSIRKFIRLEKARIRRGILDLAEQEKQIQNLYRKFFAKDENSGNIQSGAE